MPNVTVSAPADLASVGERWQALQADADASFFQSWNWIGCLAEERFPEPVLLEVCAQGKTAALALFNRRAGWFGDELWLGESGNAELDAVFTEYNGPLIAKGAQPDLLPACLRAGLSAPILGRRRGRRLILSGIDDDVLRAACATHGAIRRRGSTRLAPCVDFTALPAEPGPAPSGYLASLSTNTRYQIRRSERRYREAGALALERADTLAQANLFLDELARLHQATWTGRGRPGAFASPTFMRFHRTLLSRAWPVGEIDLLRITAGARVVGYLYNFRFRNRAYAYQSGFDYDVSHPHQKPGLTSHHLAIEMYRREGIATYDFLAGADRYKTSMANAGRELHWIELTHRRSVRHWFDMAENLRRHLLGGRS